MASKKSNRQTTRAEDGAGRMCVLLAENTPEVIARFDRQLRHTYINEYGAKVYGVPRRQVIGKTNAELGMPGDKVAFWTERFEEVFATGRQQTVDFEFDSPAFGHQYFSSLFVPELDAYGQVVSILAITRDVTAAQQAAEQLRQRVEEVETLMKVAPVAMPLMEGDEAARRIKRDMPRTRIVGLSMFEEPDAVEKMHKAGAERYMLKTAPAGELLAAIREK
jgi:PAS domain S-box-containing protein